MCRPQVVDVNRTSKGGRAGRIQGYSALVVVGNSDVRLLIETVTLPSGSTKGSPRKELRAAGPEHPAAQALRS